MSFNFKIENFNQTITSKNNHLIKRFRSFKDKLPTKEKDFFCIEGTHLLDELLKSGIHPREIIATEEWLLKNNGLTQKIEKTVINKVSKEALKSAVSTKTPDGVAALVEKSSIKKVIVKEKDDFILVLDRVQDPGNLGNLFRIALAAGVNKILLGGGANPLSQKVLRSSCGSIFHLPYSRFEGTEEIVIDDLLIALKDYSKKGFQIVLTSGRSSNLEKPLKPYWELDWTLPTVLILGNEGGGIHYKIKEAFFEIITIPHNELVESLNVACVAVPLLLERKRVTLSLFPEIKK